MHANLVRHAGLHLDLQQAQAAGTGNNAIMRDRPPNPAVGAPLGLPHRDHAPSIAAIMGQR